MPGERERFPVEPIDPQVGQSWLKIIDALTKQVAIELYAFDSKDPSAFAREHGSGRLQMSSIGDSRVLQIQKGKNLLLVDDKLKARLRLDEQSLRALEAYLKTKSPTEPHRQPREKF